MELLNSIGLTVVAFVFVLGVLIFIHELGHYLVAKYLGIRVEVFSLGFGTRLFGFRRGDTDYRVSLIPLGGYVKMAGDNPDEDLTGSPEEFLSRPKLHRFFVAIAGPAMNVALAVVLLAVNFMVGVEIPEYKFQPPVVGVVAADSPAERAGLMVGDLILSIDGQPMPTWTDVDQKVVSNPNAAMEIEVRREDQTLRLEVRTETSPELEIGYLGINAFLPYRVEKVEPGSPAERAGIQPGDEIVSVKDGSETSRGFFGIAEAVQRAESRSLIFELARDGSTREVTITPEVKDGRPRIGAYLERQDRFQKYGFLAAFGRSLRDNWRMTELTFSTVGKLLTGNASMKQMSGPIEIAKFSGLAASQGLIYLISFMAIVSLQLGILNMLPIPILDGGVIALLAVEGVLGRDLSMKVKERIFQVGFIFIVVLMGVVIFNDITKNLPNF